MFHLTNNLALNMVLSLSMLCGSPSALLTSIGCDIGCICAARGETCCQSCCECQCSESGTSCCVGAAIACEDDSSDAGRVNLRDGRCNCGREPATPALPLASGSPEKENIADVSAIDEIILPTVRVDYLHSMAPSIGISTNTHLHAFLCRWVA